MEVSDWRRPWQMEGQQGVKRVCQACPWSVLNSSFTLLWQTKPHDNAGHSRMVRGQQGTKKKRHVCQALSILAVILFCMNTCWAPHFEMSHKPFTMATLTLFSASEQIHCTLVIRNWMSDCSFTQHTLNIHRSSYNAFWLLHGWCHMKLLLSRHTFCIHHTAMCQFTVSLYSKTHDRVRLAVTCHLHFWKKDWDLLHATAVIHT